MFIEPEAVYTVEQIRAIETACLKHKEDPIAPKELMRRAAQAAFEQLTIVMPDDEATIGIVCGGGNNGGDGFTLAKIVADEGFEVVVYPLVPVEKLKGVAKEAADDCLDADIEFLDIDPEVGFEEDVVIDAMLGIGCTGPLREPYATAVAMLNEADGFVISLDIPTGLDADSGKVFDDAVMAEYTVTFIGMKMGLLQGQARDYTGIIVADDLDLDDKYYEPVEPSCYRLLQDEINDALTPRMKSSHKGDYGHVLILGGDLGMPGAARLAAEAALRVGAGLVSVATRPEHVAAIVSGRPEIMVHGIDDTAAFKALCERATVLVIGPGLGKSDWAEGLLKVALEQDMPKVIDAGALDYLIKRKKRVADAVITPHVGEAARLLKMTAEDVQDDRLGVAETLCERYADTAVLKGPGTLIMTDDEPTYICDAGNPGMASGGMGDVLSGVIAAIIAQGIVAHEAATLAVYLHSQAGDLAAEEGERGMIATDLMPYLRMLANPEQTSVMESNGEEELPFDEDDLALIDKLFVRQEK